MAQRAHWIGSIAFELRGSDSFGIDLVRRRLRSELEPTFIRPLQPVLDAAVSSDRLIRYRRVEVDLGLLSLDDLRSASLSAKLAAGLREQLPAAGDTIGAPAKAHSEAAEQLMDFLESGVLPWPEPSRALEAIFDQLLLLSGQATKQLATALRPLLARSPVAIERFVRQSPEELVRNICAMWGGAVEEAPRHRRSHGQFVLSEDITEWTAIVTRLARGTRDEADVARPGRDEGGPRLPTYTEPSAPADGAEKSIQPVAGPEADPEAVLAGVRVDELPVAAAGAVLLYPFLSGFFSSAGLLDGQGQFVDPAARARGPLLVQFLATGETEIAEPELPLAKLLCAIALDTPVPRKITPSEVEQREAEALLTALVRHWEALGDTSPEALRETFLQRPGRLVRAGEEWRLIVERRGVDVLLDRLPWPIGLVKTDFMLRPLAVDWR